MYTKQPIYVRWKENNGFQLGIYVYRQICQVFLCSCTCKCFRFCFCQCSSSGAYFCNMRRELIFKPDDDNIQPGQPINCLNQRIFMFWSSFNPDFNDIQKIKHRIQLSLILCFKYFAAFLFCVFHLLSSIYIRFDIYPCPS